MSLARHLSQQHQVTQRFVSILEQERLTLVAGKIDGEHLTRLTAQKQALLLTLERLESVRRRAQITRGYQAGAKGAALAARDEGCIEVWSKLQEMAAQAKRLNQLNGDTLLIRLQQNQRILNVLNELSGHTLYGPDGRQRPRANLSGLT